MSVINPYKLYSYSSYIDRKGSTIPKTVVSTKLNITQEEIDYIKKHPNQFPQLYKSFVRSIRYFHSQAFFSIFQNQFQCNFSNPFHIKISYIISVLESGGLGTHFSLPPLILNEDNLLDQYYFVSINSITFNLYSIPPPDEMPQSHFRLVFYKDAQQNNYFPIDNPTPNGTLISITPYTYAYNRVQRQNLTVFGQDSITIHNPNDMGTNLGFYRVTDHDQFYDLSTYEQFKPEIDILTFVSTEEEITGQAGQYYSSMWSIHDLVFSGYVNIYYSTL